MENKLELKRQLFIQCKQFCSNRLTNIQRAIDDLQESLTSETKSSAGDKHETGRAMLQLELEKAGNQFAETQNLQQALSEINVSKTSAIICLGSVVITSKTNYFIAISAGELMFNNQIFYAISPITPIGKLLIGKQVGDLVSFREQAFSVVAVY